MNVTVEQISDKIKQLPEEFLERIMEYVDALAEDKTYFQIPEWQQNEVRERIADFEKNPSSAHNWEDVLAEIDRELQ